MFRCLISSSISLFVLILQILLASFIFFLWRCGPTRAMASSFTRFLDHTQRRITVGRTPLDEWSARLTDLYLTTHNTQTDKHPCPGGIRTHDLSRRAAADLRLRPRGHWDRRNFIKIYDQFTVVILAHRLWFCKCVWSYNWAVVSFCLTPSLTDILCVIISGLKLQGAHCRNNQLHLTSTIMMDLPLTLLRWVRYVLCSRIWWVM